MVTFVRYFFLLLLDPLAPCISSLLLLLLFDTNFAIRIANVVTARTRLLTTNHNNRKAVKTKDIEKAAVTANKMAPASVDIYTLADGAASADKLAPNSVTSYKLAPQSGSCFFFSFFCFFFFFFFFLRSLFFLVAVFVCVLDTVFFMFSVPSYAHTRKLHW